MTIITSNQLIKYGISLLIGIALGKCIPDSDNTFLNILAIIIVIIIALVINYFMYGIGW